jgi:ankyrin repeat protein
MLDAGADPNAADRDGLTPLHYAAGDGHVGTLILLLERGGDPRRGDTDGDLPLHVAVQARSILRPRPATRAPARHLTRSCRRGAVLVRGEGGCGAGQARLAHLGARQEHCGDVVDFFLARDATLVNAPGGGGATALHLVAERTPPDEHTLRQLLAAGADASLQDHGGRTPLDLAEAQYAPALSPTDASLPPPPPAAESLGWRCVLAAGPTKSSTTRTRPLSEGTWECPRRRPHPRARP